MINIHQIIIVYLFIIYELILLNESKITHKIGNNNARKT